MAKVALDGTINMQGTKEIDRTNLAQLREPATITWSIVAGLRLRARTLSSRSVCASIAPAAIHNVLVGALIH